MANYRLISQENPFVFSLLSFYPSRKNITKQIEANDDPHWQESGAKLAQSFISLERFSGIS